MAETMSKQSRNVEEIVRTLMTLFCPPMAVIAIASCVHFGYLSWERRDVVKSVTITAIEIAEAKVCFDGVLVKRECDLATKNPYQSVDFYQELNVNGTVAKKKVGYAFGEAAINKKRLHGQARPAGATLLSKWCIEVDEPQHDIIGVAKHNCDSLIIGPRKFMGFNPLLEDQRLNREGKQK